MASGFLLRFPLRGHEAVALEPPQCGIDSAAGQAGDLHNIQAKAEAEAECLEDESGGMGESS